MSKPRSSYPRIRHTQLMCAGLAVIVSLVGCTSESAEAPEDSVATGSAEAPEDSVLAPADGSSATTSIEPIQDFVLENLDCLLPVDVIDGETWSYCEPGDGIELISIESTTNDITSTEVFALADDSLVHAIESTVRSVDGELISPWSVTYVIADGAVLEHESLGLGPTELDGWDPNAILDRWERRAETAAEIRRA